MINGIIKLLNKTKILKLPLMLGLFMRIYYLIYKDISRVILAEASGYKFYVDMKDRFIAPVIIADKFEQNEKIEILKYTNEDTIFLDIGANIGYYSVLLSDKVKKVYAFEPVTENYLLLNKNIEVNNLKNVTAVHKALSNKNGEVEMFIDKLNGGGHSMQINNVLDTNSSEFIPSIRLDDYIESEGIENINLIKIDVQGAEGLVFEGAMETLKKFKPIIMMEYDPKMLSNFGTDPEKLLNMFKEMGYTIKVINENDQYKNLLLIYGEISK